MKAALRSVGIGLRAVAGFIGPEGLLIGLGTACLSVAAGFFSPAGPWAVVGAVTIVLGLAVAWRGN